MGGVAAELACDTAHGDNIIRGFVACPLLGKALWRVCRDAMNNSQEPPFVVVVLYYISTRLSARALQQGMQKLDILVALRIPTKGCLQVLKRTARL